MVSQYTSYDIGKGQITLHVRASRGWDMSYFDVGTLTEDEYIQKSTEILEENSERYAKKEAP